MEQGPRYGLARIECLVGKFAKAGGDGSPVGGEFASCSPPAAAHSVGVSLSSLRCAVLIGFWGGFCAPVAG